MAETYTYTAPPAMFASFPGTVVRESDKATIPCDLGNTDYQGFLAWVAEAGNTAPEGWTGPTNASPATG